jgi:ABC-type sulfate transport system permease component
MANTYLSLPLLPSVGVFLAIAVFIPALSMLCIHGIVASPRTLLAAKPQVARAADDSRRATAIGLILEFAWLASGCLLQSIVVIGWHSHDAPGRTLIDNVLSAPFFLGMFMCVCGVMLPNLHGRLGGTLTGWRNPKIIMNYLAHGQER